jgi:hypothetical protein
MLAADGINGIVGEVWQQIVDPSHAQLSELPVYSETIAPKRYYA